MKAYKAVLGITVVAVIFISGCYTVLMTPQEFAQAQRERSAVQSDASYQVNYNQNCLSCHSKSELDDRYLELKYYGITTVHNGIVVDPLAWNTPYTSPVYEPDPYGWYNPAPSQPWWIPPGTSVAGGVNASPSTVEKDRVRTSGSTRDATETRERSQANQTPTQATPSQPVGGTTATTPSNPPPATTVTTQPPAQQPANSGSSERSRTETKSSDSGSKTRSSGSSRDSSSGDRPR